MDRRSITIIAVPIALILSVLAYYFLLVGTVTIEVNSLDPGTLRVAGKTYQNVKEKTIRLPMGSYEVTFAQADYQPLTEKVSPSLWSSKNLALSPVLTPDGERRHAAREAAASFAASWGTYSYQNFDSYVNQIRSISTAAFSSKFLPADSVQLRKIHLQASQFDSKTETKKTALQAYSESSATVLVEIESKTKSNGIQSSETKREVVTLVKQGDDWKAANITGV